MRSGTSKPHASTPPAKFSAANRGPMMYPTPKYAGLTAGEVNVVIPPVVRTGALAPRPSRNPDGIFGILIRMFFVYQNRLICERKYQNAPNPMLANRILAAFDPCCPALWISEAATDSGKGS